MKLCWAENLYISDNLKKKEKKIRSQIERDKFMTNVFLLTFPTNPQNQLDIFSCIQLKQQYVREHCPMIVGMAKGYDLALELLVQITKDCYRDRQDANIKAYLEEKSGR